MGRSEDQRLHFGPSTNDWAAMLISIEVYLFEPRPSPPLLLRALCLRPAQERRVSTPNYTFTRDAPRTTLSSLHVQRPQSEGVSSCCARNEEHSHMTTCHGRPAPRMGRGKTTEVDAITPIKRGADMNLLHDALSSALQSLGDGFYWYYACHPENLQQVQQVLTQLQMHNDHYVIAKGYITASANVAATRNQLLAVGHSDYVIQLDADDLWVPGALAMMKRKLDCTPEVAAAHGRHLKTDPTAEFIVEVPPTWRFIFPDDVARPGALATRRHEVTQAGRKFHRDPDYVAVYPIHPSAGLFRRTAVEEAGGWDEELGNYFEDSILVAKIQAMHSWYVNTAPAMFYRILQRNSLSQRNPGRQAWLVLDELARAHESGCPQTGPAAPFPTPPAESLMMVG